MLPKWLAHLKDQSEREKAKLFIESSSPALDILAKICYNSISDAEKVSVTDYDNPSWSHKQAHLNGYTQALREIIKMCEINK